MFSYDIIHVKDHYEAFIDGKFFCSGDTYMECVKEIEKERK